MTGIITIAALIIIIQAAMRLSKKDTPAQTPKYTVMRCPSCGEEARVYGDQWECTWCGDFGRL